MTNLQRIFKIPTILISTALLATSCAGTVGSAGSAGAVGPQGPQGPAGAIGSTGPQGPVGPAGPQGLAGAQGPRGFSGSDGSQGSNGLSAYQMYIADYPGYAAAAPGLGLNATQWVKDLAANTLYPSFTLDYTGQTEFNDNFTQDTSLTTFRAYKGSTNAQFPLIDLFATLTPEAGRTQTRAQYLFEFHTNSQHTSIITNDYVFGSHDRIYVKATRIGVTSIVLKNETTGSDIIATGNSKDGFALTVPLETEPYSNKFTHYLATANAAVKTDGKIYSNSAATTEFQSFLVMRDGATGTGSNLISDLLDIDDAARLSFGIWQNSGDAVPPGGYLSFASPGTFTVYLRVYFDAVSFRIVPLAITVTNQAAASIVAGSTTSSLTEAAANDGSLTSPTVTITILNGVLADPLVKADVTAANLPAGMDFTLVRTSNTVATVTITGNATNHANANDVSNLTFTIARAKVTGAIANLVTPNISINFNDPAAPDTTAPVLSAVSVGTITDTTANLIFTSGEAGTYYYLVLASAANAPIASAIKAQGTALAKGTGSATATSNTVAISGLTASTVYKVYVVVEDAAANISAVSTVDLTTIAALSSLKAITSYSFNTLGAVGTITGQAIAVTVPNGTNVTSLVATFINSASSTVAVASTAQVSGTTTNDFSSPVVYTVTAQDGTTATYTVTVTVTAASTASAITAFSFEQLSPEVTGTIDASSPSARTIALTVPFGTNVTALVATFTNSASSTVTVASTAQASGVTANDFTSPVVYTVTAQDGTTTATYTVTVTVTAASTASAITEFSFAGLTPVVTGTIDASSPSARTIALTVPFGTNVTALVASFTSSQFSLVEVSNAQQVSGTTTNDFSSPVVYTVTAQNGTTTATYTVTVTVEAQ